MKWSRLTLVLALIALGGCGASGTPASAIAKPPCSLLTAAAAQFALALPVIRQADPAPDTCSYRAAFHRPSETVTLSYLYGTYTARLFASDYGNGPPPSTRPGTPPEPTFPYPLTSIPFNGSAAYWEPSPPEGGTLAALSGEYLLRISVQGRPDAQPTADIAMTSVVGAVTH
jgi:hypothetical protein